MDCNYHYIKMSPNATRYYRGSSTLRMNRTFIPARLYNNAVLNTNLPSLKSRDIHIIISSTVIGKVQFNIQF